jgi:hypothetical protein
VGFFRQQEERMAMRFLAWRYQKLKMPGPDEAELKIARERGRNVIAIIKDLVEDIKK